MKSVFKKKLSSCTANLFLLFTPSKRLLPSCTANLPLLLWFSYSIFSCQLAYTVIFKKPKYIVCFKKTLILNQILTSNITLILSRFVNLIFSFSSSSWMIISHHTTSQTIELTISPPFSSGNSWWHTDAPSSYQLSSILS